MAGKSRNGDRWENHRSTGDIPATFDSQKVTTSSGTQMISNELNIYRLAIQSL